MLEKMTEKTYTGPMDKAEVKYTRNQSDERSNQMQTAPKKLVPGWRVGVEWALTVLAFILVINNYRLVFSTQRSTDLNWFVMLLFGMCLGDSIRVTMKYMKEDEDRRRQSSLTYKNDGTMPWSNNNNDSDD